MHLSPDGLVRVSIDELMSLPIVHLTSGFDADEGAATQACGSLTTISGYTEWISQTHPVITIGWDWLLVADCHEARCRRAGPPRANVMVVDSNGADRSWEQNLEFLGTVVDVLPWADVVSQRLSA
jgi:Domain of unknown function (DUF4902)